VGDLVYAIANEPAGGLGSDRGCKLALLGKGGDPLAGTRSAFVNEKDCAAVERPADQPDRTGGKHYRV